MKSYKELIVWQRAMELVTEIYAVTEKFPESERFGLVSQMRRCAVSIPSNIAEGFRRGGRKEFHRFLLIAYGSGGELETQAEICKNLPMLMIHDISAIELKLNEVMRMLNKVLQRRSK